MSEQERKQEALRINSIIEHTGAALDVEDLGVGSAMVLHLAMLEIIGRIQGVPQLEEMCAHVVEIDQKLIGRLDAIKLPMPKSLQ